jgi:flavin-dependent dehydrogenase
MTPPVRRVIGAGPAGLVAAATLARAGERVEVWERARGVGGRFAGDFQGLEAWTDDLDVPARLRALGVAPTFTSWPVREVTFYDARLRPVTIRSDRPLFHLVRRGDHPGSLDRALLAQAQEAGADLRWRARAIDARANDIVATGPRFADGLVTGYVFDTDLPDQAHCILSKRLAPAGYAYLLVQDGHATLASCLFRRHQDWRAAREATADTFRRLVPDITPSLADARPFAGYGSVYGTARLGDEAGRLYVGEAAGLQDPEWGFGLWYAMGSGHLAATCLLDGSDYATAAREAFDPQRHAAFANRIVFESLPEAAYGRLLRWGAGSRDVLARLGWWTTPHPLKVSLGRAGTRLFRGRLHYRDRACHTTTCDCLWCVHGEEGHPDDHHHPDA